MAQTWRSDTELERSACQRVCFGSESQPEGIPRRAKSKHHNGRGQRRSNNARKRGKPIIEKVMRTRSESHRASEQNNKPSGLRIVLPKTQKRSHAGESFPDKGKGENLQHNASASNSTRYQQSLKDKKTKKHKKKKDNKKTKVMQ